MLQQEDPVAQKALGQRSQDRLPSKTAGVREDLICLRRRGFEIRANLMTGTETGGMIVSFLV